MNTTAAFIPAHPRKFNLQPLFTTLGKAGRTTRRALDGAAWGAAAGGIAGAIPGYGNLRLVAQYSIHPGVHFVQQTLRPDRLRTDHPGGDFYPGRVCCSGLCPAARRPALAGCSSPTAPALDRRAPAVYRWAAPAAAGLYRRRPRPGQPVIHLVSRGSLSTSSPCRVRSSPSS